MSEHICHGLDELRCTAPSKHCQWSNLGCVHDLAQVESDMRQLCGTPEEQEFVRAVMKDLSKYGIRMPNDGEPNCRQLVTALISHSLLREHGLDEKSVARFVETWKSRVLPNMIARKVGYRQSLEELFHDIDAVLEKLQRTGNETLEPADLLNVGLKAQKEIFGGGNGPRILKLLAAGALLSLLFLAARSSAGDVQTHDSMPIFDEPVSSEGAVQEDSQLGLGTNLLGLGILGLIGKKGVDRLKRTKKIPVLDRFRPFETPEQTTQRRVTSLLIRENFARNDKKPLIITVGGDARKEKTLKFPISPESLLGDSVTLILHRHPGMKQLLDEKNIDIQNTDFDLVVEDDLGNEKTVLSSDTKMTIAQLDQQHKAEDGYIHIDLRPK